MATQAKLILKSIELDYAKNEKKIGRHKGTIYTQILSLIFPFLSQDNSLMHSRSLGNNRNNTKQSK